MRIRIFKFFIIIFAILSLTGCWDAYEIKDYSLITVVGVDKSKDMVKLFSEYKLPNTQLSGTQGEMQKTSNILIAKGNTFTEAMNNYLRRNANGIFLGSVRSIIFSDNYAKSGIEEYVNRVRGLRDYRKTSEVFTSTTELDKLFNEEELNTKNIGSDLEHLNEDLFKKGITSHRTITVVMEEMQVNNTGYVINNLDVVKNHIEMTGYSVFKDNRKIGLIPPNKMKGVNYLILNNSDGEYTIDFEGVKVALTTHLDKKKIKPYYDNKNITFAINIQLNCEIINLSKMIKIDSEKMKELGKKLSDIVKKDILNAIETSQTEYECDYLYFYKKFRSIYNSDFKHMNWNEKYKEAKFNIDVRAKVTPGNLINFE